VPKSPKTDRQTSNNLAPHTGGNPRPYDARWRIIRAAHISREPLCRHCLLAGYTVAATEVDHIVPLSHGGTHAEANLQSLCHACHSRKTGREQRKNSATPGENMGISGG
jgi:5-methylcytosine-specific restriction endonuclease McrA